MSDTAAQSGKQNPMQFVSDALNDLRARGVAPKLRVLSLTTNVYYSITYKRVL